MTFKIRKEEEKKKKEFILSDICEGYALTYTHPRNWCQMLEGIAELLR